MPKLSTFSVPQNLQLKVKARVMLVANLNKQDSLVHGQLGTIVALKDLKDSKGGVIQTLNLGYK